MSDTPRTDALWAAQDKDGFHDIDEVWDHARNLERELTEAKKPPPCKHERRTGWSKGAEWDEWCTDCGAKTRTVISASGIANFTTCEGMHHIAQRGFAGCQHEWRGPGEMPRRYTCGCGTVVFRSHEDAD